MSRQPGAASNTRSRTGIGSRDSEDLIKDLELQLGTFACEYMRVVVTYSHAAFPEQEPSGIQNVPGSTTSLVRTRLETTVGAVVELQQASSAWSTRSRTTWPQERRRLSDIVKRHWSSERADDVIRRMGAGEDSDLKDEDAISAALPPPTRVAPPVPVPRRQASLQRETKPVRMPPCLSPLQSQQSQRNGPKPGDGASCSSRGSLGGRMKGLGESTIETVVRDTRSLEADGILSTLPHGPNWAAERKNTGGAKDRARRSMGVVREGENKRDSGRWAWAGWF